MPNYRNKTLNSLIKVEADLKDLVKKLQTEKSPKRATMLILDAKNQMGKTLLGFPSEQYLAPIRKTLAPIINVLGGMYEGLSSKELSRTDFTRTVKSLSTKFIPAFRASVDSVAKKVNAQSSRLKDGLYQDDAVIIEELRSALNEITRASKSVASLESKEYTPVQIDSLLRSRIELAQSTAESLPTGKDLDNAVSALLAFSKTAHTIAASTAKTGKLKSADVKLLGTHVAELDRDIAAIHKKIANNILTYGEEKRKLPKATKLAEVDEAPLVRSQDAYLKDQIKEIKQGKNDLPKRLSGPFALTRSSVVAIFDSHDNIAKRDRPLGGGSVTQNFNKNALLDQYGIKYVMLEDYLILQDQRVLIIDRAAVQRALAAESTTRRVRKLNDDYYVKFAQETVKHLNERSSENFSLVANTFQANPRNADMVIFWVMPSRILDSLIRRGWNKLASWNLPFDH